MQLPKIIAEIGCNHRGDINVAKQLIESAKESGANIVKFQKRCVREILTDDEYNAPHPNPKNSYGSNYGKHREALEFTIDQHIDLNEFCTSIGIPYSCSVWDLTSAKEIVQYIHPDHIKIGSPSNLNFPIYEYLSREYMGNVHVSMGMTTSDEEKYLLKYLHDTFRPPKLFLYACTSDYPVKYQDIRLDEIFRLKMISDNVCFSGHHLGIAIDIAACMMGIKYIERHFTLDKTWKGTDHKASLTPDELKNLIESLKQVLQSRGYKNENNGLLACEIPHRNKLKKIVYLTNNTLVEKLN